MESMVSGNLRQDSVAFDESPNHEDNGDGTDAAAEAEAAGGKKPTNLSVIAPGVMKIVLKGTPHHLSVSPLDDAKKLASQVYL